MTERKPFSSLILSSAVLAGLSGLTGCSYDVGTPEPRVYRTETPPPPPPGEVISRRPVAYDDRPYEPADNRGYDDRANYDDRGPAPAYDDDTYVPVPQEAIATYETDLRPYGRWVNVEHYGRCWVPNDRPSGWRPYTVGHWDYTDDGWCWVSEDREADWGPVCYHYGRWYEDPREGWVWVPGTTWGPAWVAWRAGDGYCGWAPLPPTVAFGREVDAVYVDRYVPANRYIYCEDRYLGSPRLYDHYVRDNVTIINRTRNITNITYVNNRVVNRGVDVREVERVTGRRIQPVRVADVRSYAEARQLRAEGRPVRYQPETIARVDQDYRQRVERRVEEQRTAERQRVDRRTTDAEAARQGERQRVDRRANEADAAQQAERDRVQRRNADAQTAQQGERQRVQERNAEAAQGERQRVDRRNNDAQAAQAAERQRAQERTTEAEQSREAERQRVERRNADAPAGQASERQRAQERTSEAEQAREAERQRIERRNTEPAPREPAAQSSERSRVQERQQSQQQQQPEAARQDAHERAVRRNEEAAQATERQRPTEQPRQAEQPRSTDQRSAGGRNGASNDDNNPRGR